MNINSDGFNDKPPPPSTDPCGLTTTKKIVLKLLPPVPQPTVIHLKPKTQSTNRKDDPSEPPHDNSFQVIKCPLKAVLKQYQIIQPIIEKTVIEMNQIVILGYQFIKLFMIDAYEQDKDHNLPVLNKQLIYILITVCDRPYTVEHKINTETPRFDSTTAILSNQIFWVDQNWKTLLHQ